MTFKSPSDHIKSQPSAMNMVSNRRGRSKSNLSRQLSEFAAKRVISEVVKASVRQAENNLVQSLNHRNSRNSNSNGKRNRIMFKTESTRTTSRRSNTRDQQNDQEPVELWVNNVVIVEKGTQPVRIGTGRPLSTYKSDKPVNTKDEDFNAANAVSNALIDGLHSRAEALDKGESFMLIPAGTEDDFTGITLQVYRVENDSEGEAAAKADIESAAQDRLGNLFG